MSEPSKEDLARLLGAMAAGEAGETSDESTAEADGLSRGDAMPMPAAAARTPPRPSFQPAASSLRMGVSPLAKSLTFKQTLIPILLTLGVLCPAVASLGFMVGPLSPFYLFRDAWFCVPLFVVGFVMLVFAGLTMMQVRAGQR